MRHPSDLRWRALAWLLFLAPFFFLTYRFANWVTAQRAHVPTVVFAWEHHIPFLAWTIVPYWSTDILYAVSLFLATSRRELDTHGRRLVAAQCVSVAGFLLFPLRFSFTAPQVTGFYGWLFSTLHGFDQPFNQAPSLHLSLTVLLWAAYRRHLRGVALWVMQGWMMLVGISTLTTFQHHFIDLPAGVWVGLLAMAMFPHEETARWPAYALDGRRLGIGGMYLLGAALAVMAVYRFGGAAWLLLWVAGALGIVGVIYWAGRPDWFRKGHGGMLPAMRALLWPYLAGARISQRWWGRKETAWDEIVAGVWLGRLPVKRVAGFASVVDVTAELPVDPTGWTYRPVPMLDMVTPEVAQLEAAVKAIEELSAARPTLVCCALGYSRSASVVAAWLMASGRAGSVDEAINCIRARRPRIVLRSGHRERLEEWRRGRVRVAAGAPR